MPERFAAAAALLREAIAGGAFPAATVEVGRADGPLWRDATGRLTYDSDSPPVEPGTIFDLASLTKVIATTTLAMRAVDEGFLTLDDPVKQWLREWRGADRDTVTIRDLLAHSSGLTAYLPFFRDYTGRFEFEHAIGSLPLEYRPRSQSIYSDLGFMLLGFILENAHPHGPAFKGAPGTLDPSRSLATQFHRLASYFTAEPLRFTPPRAWRSRTAPTEVDEWRGRLLVGEVHDENTWALGGAAGHAGLFGTAAGGRRLRARGAAHDRRRAHRRQPGHAADVHAEDRRPRQLARTRLGHDAADVLVRHASSPPRRSATPASRERRSGSTGSATSTWCS